MWGGGGGGGGGLTVSEAAAVTSSCRARTDSACSMTNTQAARSGGLFWNGPHQTSDGAHNWTHLSAPDSTPVHLTRYRIHLYRGHGPAKRLGRRRTYAIQSHDGIATPFSILAVKYTRFRLIPVKWITVGVPFATVSMRTVQLRPFS